MTQIILKIARQSASYRKLFQEVSDAIILSSDAYDKGFLGEAKRLALSVRILVHDTVKSHSLFEQIGIKRKIAFAGTPNLYRKGNLLSECHLVMASVVGLTPSYKPLLNDGPSDIWQHLPFDGWWNETVIKDAKGEKFTRKDLVLWFANKEGGAHVDPQLDERYRKLQEENSYGWIFMAGNTEVMPTAGIELACMRQIAHELLRTFQRNGKVLSRHL